MNVSSKNFVQRGKSAGFLLETKDYSTYMYGVHIYMHEELNLGTWSGTWQGSAVFACMASMLALLLLGCLFISQLVSKCDYRAH